MCTWYGQDSVPEFLRWGECPYQRRCHHPWNGLPGSLVDNHRPRTPDGQSPWYCQSSRPPLCSVPWPSCSQHRRFQMRSCPAERGTHRAPSAPCPECRARGQPALCVEPFDHQQPPWSRHECARFEGLNRRDRNHPDLCHAHPRLPPRTNQDFVRNATQIPSHLGAYLVAALSNHKIKNFAHFSDLSG